jgi:hypothetical protein
MTGKYQEKRNFSGSIVFFYECLIGVEAKGAAAQKRIGSIFP